MSVTRVGIGLWCWLVPLLAWAHSGSASYIQIRDEAGGTHATISLDLLDVQYALEIDTNSDGRISWGELRARGDALANFVFQRIAIVRDGQACLLTSFDLKVDRIAESTFAVLEMPLSCGGSGSLGVHSDLLFDLDANHRTLVEARHGNAATLAVLTATSRDWRAPRERSNALAQIHDFFVEGVRHIWSGIDHLAFVIVMLLPLFGAGNHAARAGPRVLAIVTAFTVSHSITLGLAAFKLVTPAERPIEIAIAASVVIAALLNLRARAHLIGVATAFGFGLLHGFGFAAALQGLDADAASISVALLGFNLGVEVGQIAVIAVAVPVLLLLAKRSSYRTRVIPALSVAVALVGLAWIVERAAS